MGLIGQPIRILDVANAEAFVQRCMDRSGIQFAPSEREEMLAEGLTIMYELEASYEPGIGGRDATTSTFAGFAAWTLPKRLGDAWHKSHPSHRYVTNLATGTRGWVYGAPARSLNAMMEDNPDLDLPAPVQGAPRDSADALRLASALDLLLAGDRENGLAMGLLMMADYTPGKAMKALALSRPEAERALALILRSTSHLTSLEEAT